MVLIIGGAHQGKLAYVLSKTDAGASDVAYDPDAARTKPVFAHLERWVRTHPEAEHAAALEELLAANPGVVILCDEVGCGVVPVKAEERAWREAAGRLCCLLARQAERVERVFCGISMTLKGDGIWN